MNLSKLHFRHGKNAKVFFLLLCLAICLTTLCSDTSKLRSSMSEVIKQDPRNQGIEVTVYERGAGILVYDLRNIGPQNSMTDVFRVFLQFADKIKDHNYKTVKLAFRKSTRFIIVGDYFNKLGQEYSSQNSVYTIRTFPENLYFPDNTRAYESWTGGIIGVLQKQMEEFNDFHKKWYLDDLLKEKNK